MLCMFGMYSVCEVYVVYGVYNLIKTRFNSFMQGIGMHVYNIQNVALFSRRVVIHPF